MKIIDNLLLRTKARYPSSAYSYIRAHAGSLLETEHSEEALGLLDVTPAAAKKEGFVGFRVSSKP